MEVSLWNALYNQGQHILCGKVLDNYPTIYCQMKCNNYYVIETIIVGLCMK